MVIGAVIVAVTLLILGFTRELVGLVVDDDQAAKRPTIVLAVLAIYVLDFAINASMSQSVCFPHAFSPLSPSPPLPLFGKRPPCLFVNR